MSKKNGKKSLWTEFKEFAFKGNVIDMAVGVVIGGAFGKIVTGLVNYIINPFIGIFTKGAGLDGLKTVITPAVLNEAGEVVTEETAILWGTWLQTIIDFLIVAVCIFFIVYGIAKAREKAAEKARAAEAKAAEEAAAAAKAQIKVCPYCLSEINVNATRCPHCTSEQP